MERIERLRGMAKEALNEYQTAITAGGEPSYPQWAEDILTVCELAESAAANPIHVPTHAPKHKEVRFNLS